jgi:adenylate cyclase
MRYVAIKDRLRKAQSEPSRVRRIGFNATAPDSPSPCISISAPASTPAIETTYATVLFADMRGYMSLAERLSPSKTVSLLEEFFAALNVAVDAHGGEVFHMAGDEMMAGFGVRGTAEHGARKALAAARAMLRLFLPIAERWRGEFSTVAGLGIGLHFGEVALAVFGPPQHRTMTLVGDTANVAARLCSRARSGEVLFSSSVATLVAGGANFDAAERPPILLLSRFALRGRHGVLDIWCIPASIDGNPRGGYPTNRV